MTPEAPSIDGGGSRAARLLLLVPPALVLLVAALTPTAALYPDQGDVGLYLEKARAVAAGHLPYRDLPFEYPPAALIPMVAPYLAGFASDVGLDAYKVLFAAWEALLLLALGVVVGRIGARGRWPVRATVMTSTFPPATSGDVVGSGDDRIRTLRPTLHRCHRATGCARRGGSAARLWSGRSAVCNGRPTSQLQVMSFTLRLAPTALSRPSEMQRQPSRSSSQVPRRRCSEARVRARSCSSGMTTGPSMVSPSRMP